MDTYLQNEIYILFILTQKDLQELDHSKLSSDNNKKGPLLAPTTPSDVKFQPFIVGIKEYLSPNR